MPLTIARSQALRGSIDLPGDKSISHRTALFSALAEGESRIENFLVAGVTQVLLENLTRLGVDLELDGTTLRVHGRGLEGLRAPQEILHCGNSATTMRLLAGALAAAGLPARLDGSPGLQRRPMARIIDPLQSMGVPVMSSVSGGAPLEFQPRDRSLPLTSSDFTLPVASAQVKTCLLLAGLAADGPTSISEPGLSRDHSERLLSSMGVSIEQQRFIQQTLTTIAPTSLQSLEPIRIRIPGDFSSAAFLIVAAAITPESEIEIRDVGLNPTRTGLLDALHSMGMRYTVKNTRIAQNEYLGDLTIRHSPLHGTQVAGALVVRMIDEFPAFAIAAAYAKGQTVVRDAGELRHKESDRITALVGELKKIGVDIEETEDGFIVQGNKTPTGGVVDPQGDHRLAMALAISGLGALEPVAIQTAAIIQESFPGFQSTLDHLGARLD